LWTPNARRKVQDAFLGVHGLGATCGHVYAARLERGQSGHIVAARYHAQINTVLALKNIADGHRLTVTTSTCGVGGPGNGSGDVELAGRRIFRQLFQATRAYCQG
jgi:hypothetical protein